MVMFVAQESSTSIRLQDGLVYRLEMGRKPCSRLAKITAQVEFVTYHMRNKSQRVQNRPRQGGPRLPLVEVFGDWTGEEVIPLCGDTRMGKLLTSPLPMEHHGLVESGLLQQASYCLQYVLRRADFKIVKRAPVQ